jgi:hypothetical protein
MLTEETNATQVRRIARDEFGYDGRCPDRPYIAMLFAGGVATALHGSCQSRFDPACAMISI